MTPHPGSRGATLGCLVAWTRYWAWPGFPRAWLPGYGKNPRFPRATLARCGGARVQAGRIEVTAPISRHSSGIYLHRSSSHLPLAPLVLTAVQQVRRLPPPSEIRPRSPLALAEADLIPPLFSVLRFVGDISEESELRGK